MRKYRKLNQAHFQNGNFELVPIRDEDKYAIMTIRNEQIYHLRQAELLSKDQQEHYFTEVISKLFECEKPNQLLFSLLENGVFIGYGGLVHINWTDRCAEISFVMKTELEKNRFEEIWTNYLKTIIDIAFNHLNFHKLFTYAFDIRPKLYTALEKGGLTKEARLKKHVYFDSQWKDVVIHSIFNEFVFAEAKLADANQYFDWANDPLVRLNSLNSNEIPFEDHLNWFSKRVHSSSVHLLILSENELKIGQIRLEKEGKLWNINYSIASEFRGKGMGKKIISMTLTTFPDYHFLARVQHTNSASIKVFEALNFKRVIDEETVIFEYHPE